MNKKTQSVAVAIGVAVVSASVTLGCNGKDKGPDCSEEFGTIALPDPPQTATQGTAFDVTMQCLDACIPHYATACSNGGPLTLSSTDKAAVLPQVTTGRDTSQKVTVILSTLGMQTVIFGFNNKVVSFDTKVVAPATTTPDPDTTTPTDTNVTANTQPAPVPSGALLYLDASYVTGSYGAPAASCTTVWADKSGNSQTGQLTNFACGTGTAWDGGTGTDTYALNFDSHGYVVTTLDAQPSAYPEMTWEMWVRPNRLNFNTRQQFMSTDDGGYDRSLLIEANTTKIAAFTGSGVWNAVDADLNQWQHVALVYSASDIQIYKNGVPYSYGSAFAGAGTTTKKLNIGSNPAFGEQLSGRVALLAVYNRALTGAEITQHCNDYVTRFPGVTCH